MTSPEIQEPVRDRSAIIVGMQSVLKPGHFHFYTTKDQNVAAALAGTALGLYREAEGVSLILSEAEATANGFDLSQPMRCITLSVHSALDGVGLTAAVSAALAAVDCPCNMVAAFHHGHAFVPASRAKEALAVLTARTAAGEAEASQ